MKRANSDLREAMKKAGVFQWQVADALGVNQTTLTVRLRHELVAEQKKDVLAAIETAKKGA